MVSFNTLVSETQVTIGLMGTKWYSTENCPTCFLLFRPPLFPNHEG
jgi:hypothetical protein